MILKGSIVHYPKSTFVALKWDQNRRTESIKRVLSGSRSKSRLRWKKHTDLRSLLAFHTDISTQYVPVWAPNLSCQPALPAPSILVATHSNFCSYPWMLSQPSSTETANLDSALTKTQQLTTSHYSPAITLVHATVFSHPDEWNRVLMLSMHLPSFPYDLFLTQLLK